MDPTTYIKLQLEVRKLNASLIRMLYVPFNSAQSYYELASQNHLLFTDVGKLEKGVRIVGENNAYHSDGASQRLLWEDFAGQVSIELPRDREGKVRIVQQGVEFIQVFL